MDKSDFDELDRAVQSLTSDGAKTPTPADSNAPAAAADSAPAPTEPKPQPAAPAAADAGQKPVVKQRPRGRFMDIVPPRKDTPIKAPSDAPGRSGIDLAPPTEPSQATAQPAADSAPAAQPDSQLVDADIGPELSSAPVVDIASQPSESSANHEAQAEAASAVDESVEQSTPATESATAPESKADQAVDQASAELDELIDSVQSDDDKEQSSSPFISGANVEKRPLGKEPTAASEPVADPVDSIEKEPDTSQVEAQPQTTLESDPADKPEPVAKPTSDNKMTGGKVSPAPAESTGATSISQQYKVKPDEDQPAGETGSSMYDSANYAQPLAHPAKKKSGWLGVFWIVLLLAIGGGGAFVVYQLGLL